MTQRPHRLESTFLFTPAHEERKVRRALQCPCDAVILDLEASVPDVMKPAARDAVRGHLAVTRPTVGPGLWVRINPAGRHFDADLAAIDWSKADGAFIAQAEDPGPVHRLALAGASRIIPMIETARGFAALATLAEAPRVERFAIGTWDLMLDLALFAVKDPDQSELIWQLRGELVVKSRQLGMRSPVDGVHARLDGNEFEATCQRSHRLGYSAKLLIHPDQILPAQAIFAPDEEGLKRAREVLDAYDRAVTNGAGAVRVDGMMVDAPVAERARALLSRFGTSSNS